MYADSFCAQDDDIVKLGLCYLHRSEPIGFVISTIYGMYFVRKMSHIAVLHVNLRMILCTIPMQYSALCGSRVLYRIVSENPIFDNAVTIGLKIALDFMHRLALNTCCLTIMMMGVERAVATKLRMDYEHRGPAIGVTMLIVVIGIGLINDTMNTIMDVGELAKHEELVAMGLPYMDRHPFIFLIFMLGATTFCVLGSMMTLILYHVVKRIVRQYGTNLTARYQSTENSFTVEALAPTIIGYAITVCLCTSFSGTIQLMREDCEAGSSCAQFMLELTYVAINCYHYFYLCWVSFRFKRLRVLIVHDIQRLLKIHIDDRVSEISREIQRRSPIDQGSTYFNHLKTLW